MSHQHFQVSFRPRSSRITPANDDWPPTTPWHWRPSVSPLPSPTSISPLPVPSSGGTGSQPHPGPVQDSSDIVDDDLESDDSWITDDEDPSTLPSRGGRRSFGARHCQSPLWWGGYSDDYGYTSDESAPNPDVVDDNYRMGMVSDVLTVLRGTFTDPSRFHLLEPECLADFQYDVFSTLYILSCHGLLDRVFNLDPTGVRGHQSLLALRLVLGQYYPSVLPTDDEQMAPGPNDPTAPSISGPCIVLPGVSNQPHVVPLAGSPPVLTASQAHQKQRTDAKWSITIIEGPQIGGPHL